MTMVEDVNYNCTGCGSQSIFEIRGQIICQSCGMVQENIVIPSRGYNHVDDHETSKRFLVPLGTWNGKYVPARERNQMKMVISINEIAGSFVSLQLMNRIKYIAIKILKHNDRRDIRIPNIVAASIMMAIKESRISLQDAREIQKRIQDTLITNKTAINYVIAMHGKHVHYTRDRKTGFSPSIKKLALSIPFKNATKRVFGEIDFKMVLSMIMKRSKEIAALQREKRGAMFSGYEYCIKLAIKSLERDRLIAKGMLINRSTVIYTNKFLDTIFNHVTI